MTPADTDPLKSQFDRDLARADSPESRAELKTKYLGRKGLLADEFKKMAALPPEARAAAGQALNRLKAHMEAALQDGGAAAPAAMRGDVTLPGRDSWIGHAHPVMATLREICDIFQRAGYDVASGSDIETEWYNFNALNIPDTHPARDMHDTFYVESQPDPEHGPWLLRTHTSPVQIHVMRRSKPPVRVIAPGRVYRRDDDATHTPMFHQVEGLYVDRRVTLADLKGTLTHFVSVIFGSSADVRFRASYFPFTEPSLEMDIRTPRFGRWLEIMGAGMVHPNVFKQAGYDPRTVSGFAFGMGVERIAMLLYGIDDIRLFYQNDERFLANLGLRP